MLQVVPVETPPPAVPMATPMQQHAVLPHIPLQNHLPPATARKVIDCLHVVFFNIRIMKPGPMYQLFLFLTTIYVQTVLNNHGYYKLILKLAISIPGDS